LSEWAGLFCRLVCWCGRDGLYSGELFPARVFGDDDAFVAGRRAADVEVLAAVDLDVAMGAVEPVRGAPGEDGGGFALRGEWCGVDACGPPADVGVESGEDWCAASAASGGAGFARHAVGVGGADGFEVALEPCGEPGHRAAPPPALAQAEHRPRMSRRPLSRLVPQPLRNLPH